MKKLLSKLGSLCKAVGNIFIFLRNLFLNIAFLILIVFLAVLFFSQERATKVKENSGLLLSIKGAIVDEKRISEPFDGIMSTSLGLSNLPQETLLQDIIDAVKYASEDNRIKTIVLDLAQLGSCSFDQLHDIGIALEQFKLSGKRVIAAENVYSQYQYYLAAYADEIILNPTGYVDIHGLATYGLYFKNALDKLKINFHVFRVGKYKSAIEPLTRNSMSEEARAQNRQWLTALWGGYIHHITEKRQITIETITQYTNYPSTLLNKTSGDTAQLALDIGLVDKLMTQQELRSYLASQTSFTAKDEFRHVSLQEYLGTMGSPLPWESKNSTAVGIVVAQGNIDMGTQPPGKIGSESLTKLIREATHDKSIKALVLRINSGGGSAVASELIRNELTEFKKSGKILVVSMSGMAASGGYWIAVEADEIWAYPTTLTGSIGIFGAIPTFEDTLSHVGIYSDGVGTSPIAAGLNPAQPLSTELQNVIQMNIEHGYNQFIDIVSKGRRLDKDEVEHLAQGRVYDGRTALDLGLVDEIGTLEDAVVSAATLAGLDDYAIRYIRNDRSLSGRLFDRLQSISHLSFTLSIPQLFKNLLGSNCLQMPMINFSTDPKGMYAHCVISYM